MKTIKKKKDFDAVKMMRDIRNKIGADTQNMTLEEFKDYAKSQIEKNKGKLIGQK